MATYLRNRAEENLARRDVALCEGKIEEAYLRLKAAEADKEILATMLKYPPDLEDAGGIGSREAVRSSAWLAALRELTSDVNAFMASCDTEGVKIPFVPCEVLMWKLKETMNKAEALLSEEAANVPALAQSGGEKTNPKEML